MLQPSMSNLEQSLFFHCHGCVSYASVECFECNKVSCCSYMNACKWWVSNENGWSAVFILVRSNAWVSLFSVLFRRHKDVIYYFLLYFDCWFCWQLYKFRYFGLPCVNVKPYINIVVYLKSIQILRSFIHFLNVNSESHQYFIWICGGMDVIELIDTWIWWKFAASRRGLGQGAKLMGRFVVCYFWCFRDHHFLHDCWYRRTKNSTVVFSNSTRCK